MAITALATQNTQIGPAQFADMTEVLSARFRVDSPSDLTPTKSATRTVKVAAGAGTAGGSRIRSTATESLTVDAQSAGSRWDGLVLRIDWSTSEVTPMLVKGSSTGIPINSSSAMDAARVNRIPGVMYDALVAVIQVGSAGIKRVMDYRMWGGDGGPMRVTDDAMSAPGLLDARVGTWIATDKSLLTKRKDDDGVWRAVGTQSNPWKTWTPTLRYYGTDTVTGTSGGKVAGLGNGGSTSARYRIVDGLLDGYVYISPGSTGATLGTGPITFDLPIACASWQTDTWSMGHLYTRGYGGDGSFDWQMQGLVKKGWTRCMLWTNPYIDDSRLRPYVSQNGKGAGTGVPFIKGGFPVGDITMHLSYPVAS